MGWAQTPTALTFAVTENRLPNGAGSGTITPLGNDQIRVDVRITGLQPNAQHAIHIHTADGARCDTNAPVTYPLTNVQADAAGVGTSTTTVTLRAEQPVRAGNAYINMHQAVSPAGPGIICANIDATFSTTAGAQAAPPPPSAGLARSGTGGVAADQRSPLWFGVGAVVLVAILGGAGIAARARRR